MKDPEKVFIILEIAGGIVAAILIIIGLAIKAETWFFSLPSIEFTLFMLAGWAYKRIYDKKNKQIERTNSNIKTDPPSRI